MTDDLVKRLRDFEVSDAMFSTCMESADRIEELERKLAKEKQYFKEINEKAWDVHARVHPLETQAEHLVYALKMIVRVDNPKEWHGFCEELIAETLKILKGEDR
jgi:uncharacterized coiled-coil protein SlyX